MKERKIKKLLAVILTLGLFSGVCASSLSAQDEILKKVAAYEYGQDEEILARLRDYVRANLNSPESRRHCEEKLAEFLSSKATLAAKMAVCRLLRVIGTSVSVPVLEGMLLQAETSDMARYALEKIPGASADRAFLQGLSRSSGKVRIGIISSLGQRKVQDSVPLLEKLLYGSDSSAAAAAATALGQIATSEAASVLSKALAKTRGGLRTQAAASLLKCAEEFQAGEELKTAASIYGELLAANLPELIRQAAVKGMIAASGNASRELVIDMLKGKEKELYAPAISMVKDVFDESTIQEVCALLPGLPAESQVQLLPVLSLFRTEAVLSAVSGAARSPESTIRVSALKALEKVGDASTVEFLARQAAKADGEEQMAARSSLWGLSGSDIDQAILLILVKASDPDIQNELITSVGERRIYAGKSLLLDKASSSSPKSRLPAIKALKDVASPSDMPLLINLLLKAKEETEQEETGNTLAAVAGKIPRPIGRANAIKEMLPSVKDIKGRCALYRVLGRIGDDSSLSLLRRALAEGSAEVYDASVRALADWPTIAPRDDLFQIAQTSSNPVHQVLALRAYLRMVEMEEHRSPQAAVRSLKEALAIARRPEEKKTILAILPRFACKDGLNLAESLKEDEGVKAEAIIALEKIKAELEKQR